MGASPTASHSTRQQAGKVRSGFETSILTHVFSDACHHDTLVDAGTTVEELTAALLGQQSVTASGPSGVTVAGYPAQHIELTVPADLAISTCTNEVIRFWPGPGPNMSSGMCCTIGPGTTEMMDIVDVDGHRWVVAARHGPKASAEQLAALDAVLASIRIETPAAPGPASVSQPPLLPSPSP